MGVMQTHSIFHRECRKSVYASFLDLLVQQKPEDEDDIRAMVRFATTWSLRFRSQVPIHKFTRDVGTFLPDYQMVKLVRDPGTDGSLFRMIVKPASQARWKRATHQALEEALHDNLGAFCDFADLRCPRVLWKNEPGTFYEPSVTSLSRILWSGWISPCLCKGTQTLQDALEAERLSESQQAVLTQLLRLSQVPLALLALQRKRISDFGAMDSFFSHVTQTKLMDDLDTPLRLNLERDIQLLRIGNKQ